MIRRKSHGQFETCSTSFLFQSSKHAHVHRYTYKHTYLNSSFFLMILYQEFTCSLQARKEEDIDGSRAHWYRSLYIPRVITFVASQMQLVPLTSTSKNTVSTLITEWWRVIICFDLHCTTKIRPSSSKASRSRTRATWYFKSFTKRIQALCRAFERQDFANFHRESFQCSLRLPYVGDLFLTFLIPRTQVILEELDTYIERPLKPIKIFQEQWLGNDSRFPWNPL